MPIVIRSLFVLSVFLVTNLHAAEREQLIEGWEFHRGPKDAAADWQAVTLPHDWSIREAPEPEAPSGGGGGFFPTGEGWYRHSLDAPEAWSKRQVSLHFEGAYRNAEVWCNGESLATHANGYTPFRVVLDEALRHGETNEILVRVHNEPQPNSRWYSGSGLYRPVWLELRNPVHFEPGGLQVWTRSASADGATLSIAAECRASEAQSAVIRFTLLGPDGSELATAEQSSELRADRLQRIATELSLPTPQLWSPEAPALHTLRAGLWVDGTLRDQQEVRCGIRSLKWSAADGLLLNDEPVLLRGGNVHHDHGPLGAAAWPDAEERKVRLLLEAGYNAVRTAHNPPSTAFLEACDRLGMLVIDEAFDGWKSKKTKHDYGEDFAANWEADLRALVRRDRNHPSVISWSLGNEVYERGSAEGIRRAHELAALVRTLDRSRPVTVGLNGLGEGSDWTRLDPIFDALDLAGYNYELGARHAADHRRRPNRVTYASESYQREAFDNWQLVEAHPHVIGDFVWSAIDYLGEAGIGRVFPSTEEARPHWEGSHFPWIGAACGDLTISGRRKPISFYRELVWDQGTTLHAAVEVPSPDGEPWNLTPWSIPPARACWTWPGHEGEPLRLEIASRHPRVRVSLNGEVFEESEVGGDFRSTLTIPYAPGELLVEGLDAAGQPAGRFVLATAGEPAALHLELGEEMESADPLELAYVTIRVVDAEGRTCPHARLPLSCRVEGPAKLVALGNDDVSQAGPGFTSPRRETFEGHALAVLRSSGKAGEVTLTVSSEGLPPARRVIEVPGD